MAEVVAARHPYPLLAVSITPQGDGKQPITVTLSGELDRSNAQDARAAIERAINTGARSLIVDLSRLTFMDSSGIGLLLNAHNTLLQRQGHLVLVSDRGPVQRLLEIVRLSAVVPVYPSLQYALSELSDCASTPAMAARSAR